MSEGQVGSGYYGPVGQDDGKVIVDEELARGIQEEIEAGGSSIIDGMVEEEAKISGGKENAPFLAAPYEGEDIKEQQGIFKDIKRMEKADDMLMTGTIEESFELFNGRMNIRMKTLSVGEKSKIARNVERTGSILGLESYKLLTIIETLSRSIVSIDDEPLAPEMEDAVTPEEKYKRGRKVIEKWNEHFLLEVYMNGWQKLLDKEMEYFEELKKG